MIKEESLRQNAGHVENFSVEVGQVAHDEDEDRFDDEYVVGESGDEPGEETPDDADERSTQRHYQERGEPGQNVRVLNVLLAHFHVSVEHVVQHLNHTNS